MRRLPSRHEQITAVAEACPGLFVNARTDTHWLGAEESSTVRRLVAYEQAGADGAFVPGLTSTRGIRAVTDAVTAPLNLLYAPALPGLPGPAGLAGLAALGVRRLSLGSLPYRQALTAAVDIAAAVRDGDDVPVPSLTYARVQDFSRTGPAQRSDVRCPPAGAHPTDGYSVS